MKMTAQFPADGPTIISEVVISVGDAARLVPVSPNAVISFTIHTPEGDYTYTIDNAARTLTTESDKPFIA